MISDFIRPNSEILCCLNTIGCHIATSQQAIESTATSRRRCKREICLRIVWLCSLTIAHLISVHRNPCCRCDMQNVASVSESHQCSDAMSFTFASVCRVEMALYEYFLYCVHGCRLSSSLLRLLRLLRLHLALLEFCSFRVFFFSFVSTRDLYMTEQLSA